MAAFGYFVPQWVWGWDMPAGELVYGFIIGSLTALMAFGLALIYRSNRVINFAQADLGAVPASLAVALITLSALGAGRSGSRCRSRLRRRGASLGSLDRVRGHPAVRARRRA